MGVQSVDRAISLLEVIAGRPGGLVDVAERANLPVSTTARLLSTLEGRELISRDPGGAYRAGIGLQRITGSGVPTITIQDAAHADVAALADSLGEAAGLSVPIGDQTLTVLSIDAPKPVRAEDWTGHRWAITGGGSGAVMMANWPELRAETVLKGIPESERQNVRDEMAAARRAGVSWSRDSYVEGLTSVAAPIRTSGGVAVAAVMGYGPTYRFPAKGKMRTVEREVIDAAGRISKKLEV
ncbi:MAG: IclR family transcriptional regulator [Acidimicrobiales bacterium]